MRNGSHSRALNGVRGVPWKPRNMKGASRHTERTAARQKWTSLSYRTARWAEMSIAKNRIVRPTPRSWTVPCH